MAGPQVSAGRVRRDRSGEAGLWGSPGRYLLHFCRKLFLRVRTGGGRSEQDLVLFVCSGVRRAGFPGADSPRQADSPTAGGSPSKSGWGAPTSRPMSPAPARSRSGGTRSAAEVGSVGAAPAASGKDPCRRGARKPGGNSFFLHSGPRGMQAEKEETAEAGQTRVGGGGSTKWLRVWSALARTPSEKSRD